MDAKHPRHVHDAGVSVLPVPGLPEVTAGDDVAALLLEALDASDGPGLETGDVLCISTKIVSKALGLVIDPSAKQRAIEASTVRRVARRRHDLVITSVVQTPHGAIMAAAGIDGSNAPGGLLLLPEDPDGEAERIRSRLAQLSGISPGVILTDTSSRIWRQGVTDMALGCAGVASLQDLRGSVDSQGHRLSVTVRNLADELAAAADLVKGKAEGIPAAIIRGTVGARGASVPARALNRLPPEDWFPRPSLESVWEALGIGPEREPVARMAPEPAPERIARAVQVALMPREGGSGPAPLATAEVHRSDHVQVRPVDATPDALLAAGALAERIRTALEAEHRWSPLPSVTIHIRTVDPGDER